MQPRNKLKALSATLVLSAAGLGFIQQHEGTVQTAYLDAVGVPTICTGSTYDVRLGMVATFDDCAERLRIDSSRAADAVRRLVHVPLTQEQFDALVSFTFNVGEGNLAKSTLLRKLNQGDYCGAGREFLRWDKAKGKTLQGLSRRRAGESATFLIGEHCEK